MDIPVTFITKDRLECNTSIRVTRFGDYPTVYKRVIIEPLRKTFKFSNEDELFSVKDCCKYREYRLERVIHDSTSPCCERLIYEEQ